MVGRLNPMVDKQEQINQQKSNDTQPEEEPNKHKSMTTESKYRNLTPSWTTQSFSPSC